MATGLGQGWQIETLSGSIAYTSGGLLYSSTILTQVNEAYVISVSGTAEAPAHSAAVIQSHDHPGGTVSGTLEPAQFVLQIFNSSSGTLADIGAATLTGFRITLLENGS